MSSEKPAETQSKPSGPGFEKPPEGSSEVAGHKSSYLTLNCFSCGALNYYQPCWHWVTCWRCGALNSE